MQKGSVYIMSNFRRTTFYIGFTRNLVLRVAIHKEGLVEGFTQKYNLKYLVYFEEFDRIVDAIHREKQLKNWHREWKINLIKSLNPGMRDLAEDFL